MESVEAKSLHMGLFVPNNIQEDLARLYCSPLFSYDEKVLSAPFTGYSFPGS